MTKRALVLGGGGSRGAWQAGAWKALEESGYTPDFIVGTSAGALNGALIAVGTPADEIKAWWTKLRQRDLMTARVDFWRAKRWPSFQKPSGLRRLLQEQEGQLQGRRHIDLYVTAVDLDEGTEVAFSGPDLGAEHFLASAALVPGMPPVKINGRRYVDGGHWNPFPLRRALELGATHVEACIHDPIEPHVDRVKNVWPELLRRTSDIQWHGRQAGEMEALLTRTRLPKRDPQRLSPFDLRIHAPQPAFTNPILRFDPKKAGAFYERGYNETRNRIG